MNCCVVPGFITIPITVRHNRDENVLRVFRKLLHVLQDCISLTITHLKREI